MDIFSKRIMLTGGAGFLGSFVQEKLKARGCKHIFIPTEAKYDLTKAGAIERAFNLNPARIPREAGRGPSAMRARPEEVYASRRAPAMRAESCNRNFQAKDSRPDVVIHLAAKVGGIGANRANPGSHLRIKGQTAEFQDLNTFTVPLASRALDEGISICKNILRVGEDLFDPGLTTARS